MALLMLAIAQLRLGTPAQAGAWPAETIGSEYPLGADIPINDSMAWKVEVSRMGFHIQTTASSGWTSGTNISVRIVFTISN